MSSRAGCTVSTLVANVMTDCFGLINLDKAYSASRFARVAPFPEINSSRHFLRGRRNRIESSEMPSFGRKPLVMARIGHESLDVNRGP